MHDALSSDDASGIQRRARRLLSRGQITHHAFALLDSLLWTCRKPGEAIARAAYRLLQTRTHMARATVAKGLRRLAEVGLFQTQRHRVLITVRGGGRIWKQLANSYRFRPLAREFTARTDSQTPVVTYLASTVLNGVVQGAQEALRTIAEAREAKRAADWLRQRGLTE